MLQDIAAVIGPTWDFTINPVIPLAREHKVPLVVTTVFPEAPDLIQGGGFAMAATQLIEGEAKVFDGYFEGSAARTLALVYAGNAWGEVQRNVYSDLAKRRAVPIVEEMRVEAMDNNELGPIVTRPRPPLRTSCF